MLPPQNMRFMGEDDDQFQHIGQCLYGSMLEHGFKGSESVLDLGCGYGRLPYAMQRSGFKGRYCGFDIIKKCIVFLQAEFIEESNYRFLLLDVMNERYNPNGKLNPTAVKFPSRAGAFDWCCLFSVFTHLYRAEVHRYMQEINRVLRPGGRCLATFFLRKEQSGDQESYGFPDDHRHMVVHERQLLDELADANGMKVEAINMGTWPVYSDKFQDYVLFVKNTVIEAQPCTR